MKKIVYIQYGKENQGCVYLYLGLDLGGQYPRLELLHELDSLFGEGEGKNLLNVSNVVQTNHSKIDVRYVAGFAPDAQSIPYTQPKHLPS